MKAILLSIIILLFFLNGNAQFCIDSLLINNKSKISKPSKKFIEYSEEFIQFSKLNKFTKIDTSCKGVERVRAMIEKLDKGFEVKYFSNGINSYLIDSYCKLNDENINFGILEILYDSNLDAKKAYKIFFKKSYFRQYDKILRIYHPILNKKKLLILHTATPESESLKHFFDAKGITNFILEK
jgi:hypothetical protein